MSITITFTIISSRTRSLCISMVTCSPRIHLWTFFASSENSSSDGNRWSNWMGGGCREYDSYTGTNNSYTSSKSRGKSSSDLKVIFAQTAQNTVTFAIMVVVILTCKLQGGREVNDHVDNLITHTSCSVEAFRSLQHHPYGNHSKPHTTSRSHCWVIGMAVNLPSLIMVPLTRYS